MGLKKAFEKLPLLLWPVAIAFGFWIGYKNGFFDGLIAGFAFFFGVFILYVTVRVVIKIWFPSAIKTMKSIRDDLRNPERRKERVEWIIINTVEGLLLAPAIILMYGFLGGVISFVYAYLSFCLFILAISLEVWSRRHKKRKRRGKAKTRGNSEHYGGTC